MRLLIFLVGVATSAVMGFLVITHAGVEWFPLAAIAALYIGVGASGLGDVWEDL